jgi:predicted esterase YcpF (UPF0227 family)
VCFGGNYYEDFYVHGIGSSGGGNTVEMIKKYFKNDTVISPDIPVDPIEAYEFIKKSVRDCDIVIGTSLGGFYTMMIPGVYKILINPAINADETVKDVIGIGEHEFIRKRESGEKTYTIDAEYIKKLSELKKEFLTNILTMSTSLKHTGYLAQKMQLQMKEKHLLRSDASIVFMKMISVTE